MKKWFIAAWLVAFALGLPAFAQFDCADCHGPDGEPSVNMPAFEASVHGFLSCTDCHAGADENIDEHPLNLKPVSCEDCHPQEVEDLAGSLHAELRCTQCHTGIHELDPENSIVGNGDAMLQMCGRCHANRDELSLAEGEIRPDVSQFRNLPPQHSIIAHYRQSAHHSVVDESGRVAATCADCHGAHDILKRTNEKSRTARSNLSDTCGRCHGEVAGLYDESVHAEGVRKGWEESPTCAGCHNSHLVLPTNSPDAYTSKLRVAEEICLSCHEDKRLIQRYGLDSYIGSTYRDSYHSMANAKGSKDAATCIDCHTTHHILRSSDPRSSTNENQVASTCGSCHPGADKTFATSYDHKSSLKTGNTINFFVKQAYVWLILLVIGGMLLHNFLTWLGAARRAWRKRRGEEMVQRMSRGQIILHTINLLAFFTLVVTGFALRFSHIEWIQGLVSWMSEPVRALVHRIAGVIMIGLFLAHIIRIIMGKADRRAFLAMLPRPSDIRLFKHNMRYIMLGTEERPRFGKVTYMEKMEYLALIWGTLVMILTGLILWFPEFSVQFMPGWMIKVSETIHFYEAILATLAIFVWHFFFVIFNPDIYPLDHTFIDGKMPVEEIKHLRPEWYEELKKKGVIKE